MAGLFPCPGSNMPLCPFQGFQMMGGKEDGETKAIKEVICRIPKLYYALQSIITDLQRLQLCQGALEGSGDKKRGQSNGNLSRRSRNLGSRTNQSQRNEVSYVVSREQPRPTNYRNGCPPNLGRINFNNTTQNGYQNGYQNDYQNVANQGFIGSPQSQCNGQYGSSTYNAGYNGDVPQNGNQGCNPCCGGGQQVQPVPQQECPPSPEDNNQHTFNISGESDDYVNCSPSQFTIHSTISVRSEEYIPQNSPAQRRPSAGSPPQRNGGCGSPCRPPPNRTPYPVNNRVQQSPSRSPSPNFCPQQTSTPYQSPQNQYRTPQTRSPSPSPSPNNRSPQRNCPPQSSPSRYYPPPSNGTPSNYNQSPAMRCGGCPPVRSPSPNFPVPQNATPAPQNFSDYNRNQSPPPSRSQSPNYRPPQQQMRAPPASQSRALVPRNVGMEAIPPGDFELLAKIIKKADCRQVEKLLEVFLKDHQHVVRSYLQTRTSPPPPQQQNCDSPL